MRVYSFGVRLRRPRILTGTTARSVAALLTMTGFALGILVGWVVVAKFDSGWVGAIGQWFGGLATAAAVLWAVHVFRAEQENVKAERQARDQENAREAAREHRAQAERELAVIKQAARVSVILNGGGAHGHVPNQMLDSVHLTVINGSAHSVTELEVALDGADLAVAFPTSFIGPQSREYHLLSVRPGTLVGADEVSGRPLKRVFPVVTYRLDDERWRREGSREPVRLPPGM